MLKATPVVFIVDPDATVRESLESLIVAAGLQVVCLASALEFLALRRPAHPACLLLEIFLPDLGGLELQARITDTTQLPTIFITDCQDVATTVTAMKAGAFEFLTKPLRPETLMAAVHDAVAMSRDTLIRRAELQSLQERFCSLTPRERQVMELVASGCLNKQVGGELGISEVTVKAHRGKVMRKMRADSFAHLVGMRSALAAVSGKGVLPSAMGM